VTDPHGTCADCVWSSVATACALDEDYDTYYWRCWKAYGEPEVRLVTAIPTLVPPACDCHLKEKAR